LSIGSREPYAVIAGPLFFFFVYILHCFCVRMWRLY
jgi:hypothetical protein